MSERREREGGTKRAGRGIGGKEEKGTLLISFTPQPLNPGDATGLRIPRVLFGFGGAFPLEPETE